MRILLLLLIAPFVLFLMIPIGAAVFGIAVGFFGLVIGLIGAAIGLVVALFASIFGGLFVVGFFKFMGIILLIFFIGHLISKRPNANSVK